MPNTSGSSTFKASGELVYISLIKQVLHKSCHYIWTGGGSPEGGLSIHSGFQATKAFVTKEFMTNSATLLWLPHVLQGASIILTAGMSWSTNQWRVYLKGMRSTSVYFNTILKYVRHLNDLCKN